MPVFGYFPKKPRHKQQTITFSLLSKPAHSIKTPSPTVFSQIFLQNPDKQVQGALIQEGWLNKKIYQNSLSLKDSVIFPDKSNYLQNNVFFTPVFCIKMSRLERFSKLFVILDNPIKTFFSPNESKLLFSLNYLIEFIIKQNN